MEGKKKVSFWSIFIVTDLYWLLPYFILLLVAPYYILRQTDVNDFRVMIDVYGILWLFLMAVIVKRWGRALDRIWNSFCKKNNLVKTKAPDLYWADKSSIFKLGVKQKIDRYYTNGENEVYFFTIETSKNENRNATTSFMIFRTKLDKKYPFSQAIQKGWLDFFHVKPKNIIAEHMHETESIEFNRNFELNAYTPHDAFFVFSPEVMHVLLGLNWLSVEICDDYVAIFTTKQMKDPKDYEILYNRLMDLKKVLN